MNDQTPEKKGGEPLDFEEGRYLYCVVSATEDETFSMEGIEDRPVSLLVEDGIGAVVQPVESAYDSDDLTKVRRWLLSHQNVVDTAGDTFGTPLPFRFDTIFKGGDEVVTEWLQDNHREIEDALDWLAGRWEYRIKVFWNEEVVSQQLRKEDDQLQALSTRIEDASSGTGYLLESQYEQRLSEQLQLRSEELEERLIDDIEPYAVEIHRSDGISIGLSGGDSSDQSAAVELSVLADSDHEESIGEQLEPFADRPQYEVQYTGPWPPYSHAPEIGGGDEP